MDEDYEDLDSNDEYSSFDVYGTTPPRTRILRRNRDKKQKHAGSKASTSTSKSKTRHSSQRRNAASTLYDDLISKSDNSDVETAPARRSSKHHIKMLRNSERDLKLDIVKAHAMPDQHHSPKIFHPSYHIESDKRFMCLLRRTFPCHKQNATDTNLNTEIVKCSKPCASGKEEEYSKNRVDFYETLKLLIKMGGSREERNTRRGISREEAIWQNELKDLIWLELQAYHSDRTPIDEDEYLCIARGAVDPLLQDIMFYRFKRNLRKYSSHNSDSGVEDDCNGCLSLLCSSCVEAQNEALKEVEELMQRLEDVETLFPSSKAFAELYPVYNSLEFVCKVKAISLWYNLTKIQRLKLSIIGRLVMSSETKQNYFSLISEEECPGSPSDSQNSSGSFTESYARSSVVSSVNFLTNRDKNGSPPYRNYIENVLKTHSLHKSLNFLEQLHHFVLNKVVLTLEKPHSDYCFPEVCVNEEEELHRYGCWSPEADKLNLPSYCSLFLFLAQIPLSIIAEYFRMRLQQKPDNPSSLSIRQLMRELKEGLKVGMRERERLERNVSAIKNSFNHLPLECDDQLTVFDDLMTRIFKDYLEYLEQWVLCHQNSFQKNLLEEEYSFSCGVGKLLPKGQDLLICRYANILGTIFQNISERLLKNINELLEQVDIADGAVLKQSLFFVCRELQYMFNEEKEMSMKTMAFCKKLSTKNLLPDCENEDVRSSLLFVKTSIISVKCRIPEAITKVQNLFNHANSDLLDDIDKASLTSRIREILMQIYKFGFEFYKEMADSAFGHKLASSMVCFAKLWMRFVTERCEKGRGMRPRWASQGMEFLLTVSEPAVTKYLADEEFEDLKNTMDECISHLIGTTTPSTPDNWLQPSKSLEQIRTKSRSSSPSAKPVYKSQRSAPISSKRPSIDDQSPNTSLTIRNLNFKKEDIKITIEPPKGPKSRCERVEEALDSLEAKISHRLYEQQLIGKVTKNRFEKKYNVRPRHVPFSWQRGIKIGQGRFGKVYTAVNNNTGEMMAVKEIPLQHNDQLSVKMVSEEMKIFEGLVHENLVRYYGLEVYTDKMLLFMEFCAEGTLENLIAATENGLPELLMRKYTYQLLCGVACLHDHGIVHRDIKPANIFLTEDGNCLKIGDFGCAAKIKLNSTMPGELQGFVGTQAYMAPEVFTKSLSEGHGRASDIWSVGCVVIEMASGKRPWSEYDSNYQIMYKVGMGHSPDPPDNMTNEGLNFIELCFKHDPKDRATASELLAQTFVKISDDLE